jgi:AcrR family transcriptional regulator
MEKLGSKEAIKEIKNAQKEVVADMKRNFIMEAALKVVARDGYLSARLEDIADEAGFSKAYIYRYFPDKEALFAHSPQTVVQYGE